MKVKRNEKLFFEVYKYAARMTNTAYIIEKEDDITQEEFKKWATECLNNINDFKDWMKRVSEYVKEN